MTKGSLILTFIIRIAPNSLCWTRLKGGGENVELVLNPVTFLPLKHAPVSLSLLPDVTDQASEIQHTETSTVDFIKKAEQRAQYDENIRIINLDEIVVTAGRIVAKRDEERLKYALSAGSDYTIYRETITQFCRINFISQVFSV